ncbi:MAG TPA: hypothetical protein VHK91_06280 [Flavisolibacter sp.]|jgi:hypothetical protein|nr:hypothetical protein [Flavisolibacter sp.]
MKTIIVAFLLYFVLCVTSSFAQSNKATIKVAGNCGMCKKKIEKAATGAGASHAIWSPESKLLKVTFNLKTTSVAKIEDAVAHSGYDTEHVKATDGAYAQLDECCQYVRSSSESSCCTEKKCAESNCMKDGKCAKDMQCCKESACLAKACCKN